MKERECVWGKAEVRCEGPETTEYNHLPALIVCLGAEGHAVRLALRIAVAGGAWWQSKDREGNGNMCVVNMAPWLCYSSALLPLLTELPQIH